MNDQASREKSWFARVFSNEDDERLQHAARAIDERDQLIATLNMELEAQRQDAAALQQLADERMRALEAQLQGVEQRARAAEGRAKAAEGQAHGAGTQMATVQNELESLRTQLRQEADARARADSERLLARQRQMTAEQGVRAAQREIAAHRKELEDTRRNIEQSQQQIQAMRDELGLEGQRREQAEHAAAKGSTEASSRAQQAERRAGLLDDELAAERLTTAALSARVQNLESAAATLFGEHAEQALRLLLPQGQGS